MTTTPAVQPALAPLNLLPAAAPRTVQIEVWSDVACPWCYIGKRRFATALAAFPHREHVQVTWRSYELQPDAERSDPNGERLTEREMLVRHKGLPAAQVDQMLGHVTAQAAGEGLAYDFDRVIPANTFDAHRLVHIAAELAPGDLALQERLVEALMSAHFEQGLAVDDPEVLVTLAVGAGLDADAVRTALAAGQGAAEVRADEATARQLGVNGVPFFVADRAVAVSGAQPPAVFTQLLETAWQQANPLVVLGGDADVCADDSCAL